MSDHHRAPSDTKGTRAAMRLALWVMTAGLTALDAFGDLEDARLLKRARDIARAEIAWFRFLCVIYAVAKVLQHQHLATEGA